MYSTEVDASADTILELSSQNNRYALLYSGRVQQHGSAHDEQYRKAQSELYVSSSLYFHLIKSAY